MSKYLGKIESVRFGLGGYQEAQFGISFDLRFDSCSGIGDFWGTWDTSIDSTHAKWTELDRDDQYAQTMRRISELLNEAKVKDVTQLRGIPVEVELEGNTLKSWRVLTEVL